MTVIPKKLTKHAFSTTNIACTLSGWSFSPIQTHRSPAHLHNQYTAAPERKEEEADDRDGITFCVLYFHMKPVYSLTSQNISNQHQPSGPVTNANVPHFQAFSLEDVEKMMDTPVAIEIDTQSFSVIVTISSRLMAL